MAAARDLRRAAGAVTLALGFASTVSAEAPRFHASMLTTGESPNDVAVVDLDGDGALDVVVATDEPGLTVRLGRGDGSFVPGPNVPTPAAHAIAIGDVDADLEMDLAIALVASPDVLVVPATGAGTFGEPTSVSLGAAPVALRLVDMDDDGALDLVVATELDERVTVSYGDGEGAFGDAVVLDVGGMPVDLDVGDVDGDGRRDVVVALPKQDRTALVRAIGARSFAAPIEVSTAAEPIAVGLLDLEPDGDLDLVVLTEVDEVVEVYVFGPGGYGLLERKPVNGEPRSMLVEDVDGDGRCDVVVSKLRSRDLTIIHGTDEGILDFPRRLATGIMPEAMAAGDLDADGAVDLAVLTGTDGVVLHRGRNDGWFHETTRVSGDRCQADFEHADLDGDGVRDLVGIFRGNGAADHFAVRWGRADGTFEESVRYIVGSHPSGMAVADVNEDGRLDVVTANRVSNAVGVLVQTPDRGFDLSSVDGVEFPADVVAADLDGDDLVDVVASGPQWVFLRGRGDATFDAPVPLGVTDDVALHLADMDEDGDLDIVGGALNVVCVVLNEGASGFGAPIVHAVDFESAFTVAVGDVDDDELEDVVAMSFNADTMIVLRGQGDGTLEPGAVLPAIDGMRFPTLGDVNGDGLVDVIATVGSSIAGNELVLLAGNGTGAFSLRERFALPSEVPNGGAEESRLIDLDDDGDLDVVMGWCSNGVTFHLNGVSLPGDLDGDGSVGFNDLALLLGAWGPCSGACPADLDGDGGVGFNDLALLLGEILPG